jgi:hypothetical protein
MSEIKKINVGDIVRENIQIKSDIATALHIITRAFNQIGINMAELSDATDIGSVMMKVIPKLTMSFTGGSSKTELFAEIKELVPIIDRYKHLNTTE